MSKKSWQVVVAGIGREMVAIDVAKNLDDFLATTITMFRTLIHEKYPRVATGPDKMRLLFAGEQLEDILSSGNKATLNDYLIQRNSVVLVIFRFSAEPRAQEENMSGRIASLERELEHRAILEERLRTSNAHSQEKQLRTQLEQMTTLVEELRQQLAQSTQLQKPVSEDIWNVPREQVELIEEIGRGGWGLVFRGRFRGEVVAVKKAHREILKQHLYTIRLMKREIQIMASVQHPNLVRFIAAVIDDKVDKGEETPLLVVEMLDMDLRHAYSTQADFGSKEVLVSIFSDIAYGLHYLHEHQEPIIHRDVSAPNVLLKCLQGGSFRAKVSDFGSANKVKDARTAGPGAVCYTAPEVFPPTDPEAPLPPQTPKIDVFSYGILLAEVIAKTMPTTENRALLFREVRRKWQIMYDLIITCTRRNPSDRPTMAGILKTLSTL